MTFSKWWALNGMNPFLRPHSEMLCWKGAGGRIENWRLSARYLLRVWLWFNVSLRRSMSADNESWNLKMSFLNHSIDSWSGCPSEYCSNTTSELLERPNVVSLKVFARSRTIGISARLGDSWATSSGWIWSGDWGNKWQEVKSARISRNMEWSLRLMALPFVYFVCFWFAYSWRVTNKSRKNGN